MQDLFREFAKQIDMIDVTKVPGPREKPQNGEIVLGPLPIKLRQLYVFHAILKAKVGMKRKKDNERIDSILKDRDSSINVQDWDFLASHIVLNGEVDFIWDAFRLGVKREFSRAALAIDIAVRREWVAVIPFGKDSPIPATQFRIELQAW